MRNISMRFWVLASLMVAINVGGWLWMQFGGSHDLPRVRLLAVTPTVNVEDADRFTFTFDEPLVEAEHIGQSIAAAPFEIKPAIAGKWQWAHPDQLVFLFESKLPPGNQWSIQPAANFESTLRRKLVGEGEYTFQTTPLALITTYTSAVDREHATIELRFNQPVRPSDVLRLATFSGNDREGTLNATMLTTDAADRITLRVAKPAGSKLVMKLDGSLTGDAGNVPMGFSETRTFDVGQQFRMVGVNVSRPGVNPDVSVRLEFSNALQSAQTLPPISVEPKVEGLRVSRHYNYVSLKGPFKPGTRYMAKVPATLLDRLGQTLIEDAETSFEIPDRRPELKIPVTRGSLMPQGNLLIDLKAVNVDTIDLTAHRVHANNLVAHVRGEDITVTGREFTQREIKLNGKNNEPEDIAIDLRKLLDGATPGVYAIEARAHEPNWLNQRAVVAITNLAITAKEQRGGYHVWVTSLRDAKPLEGVTVAAMTYNNQSIREAVTDANGFVELKGIDNHPDGDVWLITAQKDDDLCYLQPARRKWVLDEIDQSGRQHPTTYDVMLYTERGVYRPGDTVHLTGILREPDGKTPPAMPLELRVRRPDGRLLPTIHIPPTDNAQQMFHVDVSTQVDGQTGRYEFDITIPGSKTAIGQTTTLIEAFVPVRMEVKANASKARFGPDEPVEIAVDARYLFGQAAAGLLVKVIPTVKPVDFKSKRFADYEFGGTKQKELRVPAVNQVLDEQGKAKVKVDVSNDEDGVWKVDVVASVTEPGGRSVTGRTSTLVDKIDRHIGLNLKADRFVLTNRPNSLAWCFVDGNDELIEGKSLEQMKLTVERLESEWFLQEVDGRNVWKVRRNAVTVVERDVNAASVGDLSFQCNEAGSHRLTLASTKTKAKSQIEFFAVERATEWNNVSATTPERLRIELEREHYEAGSTARVLVHSPFKGTLMLTLETDRVVQAMTFPMVENTAVVDLPVSHTLRGGGFITATVVRPIDPKRKEWLPHRAMGIVRLKTTHDSNKPVLTIEAPEHAEPGQTVEVVARVENTGKDRQNINKGMMHVWAVDDGILLTTGFRTPDPQKYFFAPRRGFVTTSDTFADMMPDHARPISMLRIGAGGKDGLEEEMAMRRNPTPTKVRVPAVVWATAMPVGESGEIRVPMTMPKMTGRMRIMAVYVEGDQYTSEDRNLTLTSPLVAEWSWPRFAAPGDSFDVPIKVFNTTDEPLVVDVNVEVEGPMVEKSNHGSFAMELAPNASATHWQRYEATELGQVNATVRVHAVSPTTRTNFRADNVASLAVRSAAPLHADIQFVRAEAGKPIDIKPSDEIEAKTARLQLHISGNPSVQLRPAVEQLLDYPYGCVEQTTSRLMAIVHAHEIIALDQPNDQRIAHAQAMVKAGIARLWSMQTTSGGLSYWPGDRTPTLWGTAYAAAFLVDAKAAGFKVNDQFIDPLLKYLAAKLKTASNDRELEDNTRALIVRVLATFDQPDEGWMARLSERVNHLDIAGRSHLAGAWLAIGRKDKARQILLDDTLGKSIATTTSGRLTSQVSQDATLLKVLLDLDENHIWVSKLVLKLNQSRKQGMWGTTVSNAAAINALSAYQARQKTPARFVGTIMLGSQQAAVFDHMKPALFRSDDANQSVTLITQGQGDVFITAMTRGLATKDAIKPHDNSLRVRRRWLNRNDEAIDPSSLKVGDLVFVAIDVESPQLGDSETIDNIAIVDALPAGMEVENPRLSTAANSGHEGNRPDRVEFLDDRVILFASATRAKRTYHYMLRVTTKGQFAVPPIQASCMYDPAVASLAQAGVMQVTD